MSERFYTEETLLPGTFTLTGEEAHHLAQVRRLRCGEKVVLFNGDGQEYPARIINTSRKEVELEIFSPRSIDREPRIQLTIAIPLPKGDRCHFLLEKLTELGVNRLIPLETARSVVSPGEGKVEKLRRYVIEASKQCGRNRLMIVDPLLSWERLAGHGEMPATRWIADPNAEPWQMYSLRGNHQELAVAIGPEGGWTESELELATAKGWKGFSLGPRILRMETAAIGIAAALCIAGLQ